MAVAVKTPSSPKILEIRRPDLQTVEIPLEGLSPLIVNRWSEKAMRQIEENQQGKVKMPRGKKEPRNPEAEFLASSYRLGDGDYGFPAGAFRKAAISAVRNVDGMTMAFAKGLFVCPDEYVQLITGEPEMDVRPVRLQSGVADLRYRAKFWPWSCVLKIRFFAGATSAEQIANLMIIAGECVGVGELRPERGGSYGRFTIKAEAAEGSRKNGAKRR